MAIKSLILLLLFVGCGRDVNLTNSKLENSLQVNRPPAVQLNQSGVLYRLSVKGTTDEIHVNGQKYKVSLHSSYNSLEFIAKMPISSVTNVSFKGTVVNNEILLESIK